jgi:hypothetical protein
MPIQFDPNSPIPDEFDPSVQQKPNKGQGQVKMGPPNPTPQQIKDRPQILKNREASQTNNLDIGKTLRDGVKALGLDPDAVGDTLNKIATPYQFTNPGVGLAAGALGTALKGSNAGELQKAAFGGLEDAATGLVNLPTQVIQGITGRPWYKPINTGLIAENNNTATEGMRTLARYAFASALPIPGLSGASGLGVKAIGKRAAEGFVQDFAGASGYTDDETFIGNIPGLRALQTNEAYSPLLNRAVVGIEGALFSAGFGEAAEALGRLHDLKKAGKPIVGNPQAQADLDLVNSVGPTMKYGGSPNELVVDGLKAASFPAYPSTQVRLDPEMGGFVPVLDQGIQMPTVPFTAPSLRQTPSAAPVSQAPTNFKPVDMSNRNIQSINFENANGQPGFDLWFADKRFPALLPGTVKKVGKQGSRGRGYGNYIVVESIDPKTGEKVDVLYAHLADGGIKVKEGQQVVPGMEIGTQGGTGRVVSADGTIASIDFLAPAAKESKSMKPYKRFNELRRELAEQIGKGGITPGQASQVMSDVANAVPAGQADEVIQEATDQLELLTRKEALEAGYEVSELVPVAARNDVNDVAVEMIKRGPDISVENTARPAVFSLTDNEIRAIGGSSEDALRWANSLAETVDYDAVKAKAGLDDIDIERIRENVRQQWATDIMDMSDEQFAGFLDEITVKGKDGRTTVNDEGIFALTFKLNELASQSTDLAKAAINADINGQNPQLTYLRALDRGMAMMQLEKVANKADSWNLARRGALRNEDQVLTKAAQEQINANQQQQALRDTRLSLMKEARDAIIRGDEAWLEKLPAAMRALAAVGANPKEQLNVWKTLATAVLKSADANYTGSLLTGPGTQSINFQSVLMNGLGHPALAYLARVMPGPENKAVREEAVAAMSATMDTVRELNNLIPRLWTNQADMPQMLGREFVGLDDVASRNLERVKTMLENGELNAAQSIFYHGAVKLHNFVQSPLVTGYIRKAIGTFDQVSDVVAGRQLAYRRAWLDARALLGDAPNTPAYNQKFAKVLEQQRKQHLGNIFDEDGFTLLDSEAKQLADAYAFRLNVDEVDGITKSMIAIAEKPGMKLLGLTFVRSPAAMMKSMTRFTPGLSNFLRSIDSQYKEGSSYYRAFIDGANSIGWFLGISSYINGYLGVQTGAGPLRGQERDSWSESNQAFSMKLPAGGQVNYQWVEPISSVMGFFADLGYYTKYGAEQAVEENFARGLVYAMSKIIPSAGSNIINKSYFTQLAQFSQLANFANVGGNVQKLGSNVIGGSFPQFGLRNQLGGVADPMLRELRSELLNTFDWFIQRKGGLGLSRFAPEDLDDVTGKPLYKNGVDGDVQSSLLQAFNLFRPLGVTVSKNRFKPVHKYLTEVGVDVADTKDKILGVPLSNEERTEFTRLMTQGGQFEKALLSYFKSDAYKFDKAESELELQQGMKQTETSAYKAVTGIIQNYTRLAMYEMGKGLTQPSISFMNRRSGQLNQARSAAFERQQRANNQSKLQQLREYPFQ